MHRSLPILYMLHRHTHKLPVSTHPHHYVLLLLLPIYHAMLRQSCPLFLPSHYLLLLPAFATMAGTTGVCWGTRKGGEKFAICTVLPTDRRRVAPTYTMYNQLMRGYLLKTFDATLAVRMTHLLLLFSTTTTTTLLLPLYMTRCTITSRCR